MNKWMGLEGKDGEEEIQNLRTRTCARTGKEGRDDIRETKEIEERKEKGKLIYIKG